MESSSSMPTLRWGIIGTGLISSWFAIGSSSIEKGTNFVKSYLSGQPQPTVYASYQKVYDDPKVDIIYIGTPHAFHKQNCLDAIAAGKHVLCEKAFTLNSKDGKVVLDAAKAKGVFIMEAMWTRFHPILRHLQKALFEEKVIGDIRRTFCDFGLAVDIASLGSQSRLKNPALGAGSLLDIGIYSLTWGILTLDKRIGDEAGMPKIVAAQSLADGVDVSTSMILQYPSTGRQGILTSTTEFKTSPTFCRIEGTKGYITVEGPTALSPRSFSVWRNNEGSSKGDMAVESGSGGPESTRTFDIEGRGFYWEADTVALDIAAGTKENATMPHAETLRVMKIMDEVRREGGARFPQDNEVAV
ncbi:NAD(P)-binding protein [Byssothecium circinans]|uniref:D-xylose 1-dehydrogenase (NADP(+), D-xylono-1,5-lactone-forming) n=1 Tax=Byssothecium circinans TaxID=147558 RepID=A0A6A5TS33_9PLEO|nr:NAD(P)-binding protein [Byssothecium circinans]